MKHILFLFLLLSTLATAQKPQPIQVQTINDSVYVVEFIPISKAQANVDAQLTQVNKQIETVDKQIADLVAKRDKLVTQQKALTFAAGQLDKAATAPQTSTSTKSATPASDTTAPPAKPAKKKPKPKTKKQ